jgi:hypothetical protein
MKNKKKDGRIKELEEELRCSKKDKETIKEFKLCTERVIIEIRDMVEDMYENMQFL